jgi:acetolactate synthase-1/2/3 large subunit
MKVYDAVANAFVKEGTTTVFGLLGSGQMSWWSSMAKHPGVRIVDVREEGSALAMAEGWAKATGKVGVCSVTHGPGLARLGLSLIAATRSRTPIVVHTSKTTFNDERVPQFLNQEKFVSGTEAGYIEVLTPGFAESAVRQAFYRAKLESRPIVLAVPMDIQGKECDSDGDDYQTSATLFSGRQRIRPDLDCLRAAVQIIAESKKPVVLLGRGAMEPRATQAADRLAARIGALIATTLIAKGVLAECEYHAGISGMYSTRAAMQLFEEADCVIAIGAGLNIRTIAGGHLYPHARIIHIDILPHLTMGTDNSADCYIQGDAGMTTQEMDDLLAQSGVAKEGYRTEDVRKALLNADRDPAEFEIEPGTVDPREALRVLDERLPVNVGLIAGSAHNAKLSVWHLRKPRPRQVYLSDFTGVGQVLGNAIGVAAAVNEPIVAVDGDGGAMQNIQELDTAARLKLKLLYFIVNDEAYGSEYHHLNSHGRDGNLSAVPCPDLGAVGRAFGCRGRIARTLEDVAAGIDEFMAGNGPMVLDVRTSRNVTCIPYRRVYSNQDI